MNTSILSYARKSINSILGLFDFELVRKAGPARDYKNYIAFKETLREAKNAGLSVGNYIEARYDQPGSSQETIDKMKELGVFDSGISTVCEIGPGSGRYLGKTIQVCHPDRYEIYETAKEWQDWLVEKYKVIPCKTDSLTLSQTEVNSIDLVQAHKVFSTIALYEILHYFRELARISRGGGKIVFDVITENSINDESLNVWLKSYGGWPNTLIPKQFAIDFFSRQGFSFNGSFLISQRPFQTECLIFTNRGERD